MKLDYAMRWMTDEMDERQCKEKSIYYTKIKSNIGRNIISKTINDIEISITTCDVR